MFFVYGTRYIHSTSIKYRTLYSIFVIVCHGTFYRGCYVMTLIHVRGRLFLLVAAVRSVHLVVFNNYTLGVVIVSLSRVDIT
jgi:hypothetical protein